MKNRIFGIETEYGINYVPTNRGRLTVEETATALFKPVLDQWRSTNVFLPNGGRLYLDVGSHPEYATAECTSIEDLIAQERAGETLFTDLSHQAQENLTTQGHHGRIYLFKNNVDSAGNSYGSHENYLISRKLTFPTLVEQLVPFLITRQILVGAGKTHPAPGPTPGSANPRTTIQEPSYSFSQRADHIWEAASTSTSRTRPLINTRDEPHADASRYRRLHVINGDSNMAEPTILLKILSTHLVLRMLEDRFPLTSLEIASIPPSPTHHKPRSVRHRNHPNHRQHTLHGPIHTAPLPGGRPPIRTAHRGKRPAHKLRTRPLGPRAGSHHRGRLQHHRHRNRLGY